MAVKIILLMVAPFISLTAKEEMEIELEEPPTIRLLIEEPKEEVELVHGLVPYEKLEEDKEEKEEEESKTYNQSVEEYTLKQLKFIGIINWGGYKFTYYSQSVLPGGALDIPGRHVSEKGYIVDGEGYIVLANDAPRGTIIDTPFGAQGKVYDRGTNGNHYDVYTE